MSDSGLQDQKAVAAKAWPPRLRRRLTYGLTGPLDGGAPSTARFQPGAEAFPKRAFELSRDEARAPEGRSTAYLRLVRRLWLDLWAREAGEPRSPREAWLQRLHAAVLRAHELEGELLDRLESRS